MAIMARHNVINPRCALTSMAHSHTLIEKGRRVRNKKNIWLLLLQVIGEINILLL